MIAQSSNAALYKLDRKFILVLSIFMLHHLTYAQHKVAIYFSAHEDDWQLFMNPNAYEDVYTRSTKVVFVYLTAGDAGAGLGNGGHSQPYYLARENGAKLSVKFMVDAKSLPDISVSAAASFAG